MLVVDSVLIRSLLGAGVRKADVFCLLGNRRILIYACKLPRQEMRIRVAGCPLIKQERENKKSREDQGNYALNVYVISKHPFL